MKKLLAIVMILAMSATLLISCGTVEDTPEETECTHEFKDATCTVPKTCTKCGETEGEVIAHTVENGKCPTCDASLFDVMKLWDEEPGQYSNSEPVYDYYNKNSDEFTFWGGKAIEFGEKFKVFGVTEPVLEYRAVGRIIITREGVENKTYEWNLIVQKYDPDSNSNTNYVMEGKLDAAGFSKDSTLVMDTFSEKLTEDKANEYVSSYATTLIWGGVTGNIAEFLSENGEDPTVLGFANYK